MKVRLLKFLFEIFIGLVIFSLCTLIFYTSISVPFLIRDHRYWQIAGLFLLGGFISEELIKEVKAIK
ncbi:hypothetical protein AYR55_03780 [Loigolactobacillus backii]|nr:hypothetical protein AYR55_03780 [Loigolactobacillus backii]